MVTAKALLTELTLVGGGALTLAALLDLLMVTFGASGMDGAVRNQAAATGTQPVPYVGQLLNRYLGTVLDGIAPATWAQPIQEGLSYLANGTLYLTSAATAPIADFQRWAWDSDGANLEQYAVPSQSTGGSLTNGIYIATPFSCSSGPYSYSSADWYYSQNSLYTAGASNQNSYPICVSPSPGRVYAIVLRNGSNSRVYVSVPYSPIKVGLTYVQRGEVLGNAVPGISINDTDTWYLLYSSTSSSRFYDIPEVLVDDLNVSLPPLSSFEGDSSFVGDPDTFVGPMLQGQGTELPLSDVVDVSSGTASRAHLFDYLHAGASAYAGTGVAELPVTDVGTGEDQLLPLNVPLDTPIGVTGVSDGTIAGSGSLAGADAIAGDFLGTDAYTMDLTQFFPFCIPFDLFALYQKFEAEAAAPVVDWPIPMPGGGDPLTVHLDFSAFDQLAVWVRRLELISFAVGLMILTKNLIQGGD